MQCILKNSYIKFCSVYQGRTALVSTHFLYFPGKINRYLENTFPATYVVVCDFFEYILSISNNTHSFTILLPYILIARYFQKVFLFKVCILFGITSDQFWPENQNRHKNKTVNHLSEKKSPRIMWWNWIGERSLETFLTFIYS